MIPTTNTILAANAAVPASPAKPNAAAINAITKNNLIDVKVILENLDLTSLEDNNIPIEVIYENKKMKLLYNELNEKEINKKINTFVENQLLLNIVNKNDHKILKNRL